MHHNPSMESIGLTRRHTSGSRFAILFSDMKEAIRPSQLRVVSLAPSATSILCAIGAKKYLVGVTKWCADVSPVNGLPKLGDCWHMDSVDEILKLKPSLVIGSVPYKQGTLAKLLEHPLSFLATNPRTLADIENDIRMLGRIVGRAAQAELLVRKMRQEFVAIAKKSRTLKNKPRVYCEAWPNPRISSPPWVAEIVKTCGGEMVMPPGQKVSDEQVASAQPDVIVLAWAATGDKAKPQKSYQVATWKDVPAVRNKQVYVVRDELLNTPGPPLVAGAKQLFRILQNAVRRENKE
ncbi:MAG TPA: ABC transporter substrate-binding protein [Candidatus Acidoferrum sp.]|nr:ABC transporter substrate-binding protein [Candidatus Acidoferrum sp.]